MTNGIAMIIMAYLLRISIKTKKPDDKTNLSPIFPLAKSQSSNL
jgi:hypothetical protein